MTAFVLLVRTHLRGFLRDRSAWFWSFMFPVFFVLMFGLMFGGGQQNLPKIPVGVVNDDRSIGSVKLIEGLKQVPIFDLKAGTEDGEREALKRGERRAVVVIPRNFSRSYVTGEPSDLKVWYDESQPQVWQTVRSSLDQALVYVNQSRLNAVSLVKLKAEPIQRHSRERRFIDFLLPGIIAMSIMQLGLFSAIPIVREREQGILRRIGATPLPRPIYVMSQVAFRVCVGFMQTGLLMGVGMALYHVRFEGSLLYLCLFIILGSLTFIMIGGVLGSIARTTEGAIPLVQMVNFPFMFLGGVFFPVDMMPKAFQPVVHLIPTLYLSQAIRSLAYGQAEIRTLLTDAAILIVWLVGGLIVASKTFRWD